MRRWGGRIKIRIYPNAQLIKEREALSGLADDLPSSVVSLGEHLIWSRCFSAHAGAQLAVYIQGRGNRVPRRDGPIGNELFARVRGDQGGVGLNWAASGFRELETVDRNVRHPRRHARPTALRAARRRRHGGDGRGAGSIPVTVDFSEVYTALASTHTVDAIETTPAGSDRLQALRAVWGILR